MALTFSATNPPRLNGVAGQHFRNIYPQTVAGASGNVITLGAAAVLSVRISGTAGADFTWSYAKPTLTLTGLTDTNHYDIIVEWI